MLPRTHLSIGKKVNLDAIMKFHNLSRGQCNSRLLEYKMDKKLVYELTHNVECVGCPDTC